MVLLFLSNKSEQYHQTARKIYTPQQKNTSKLFMASTVNWTILKICVSINRQVLSFSNIISGGKCKFGYLILCRTFVGSLTTEKKS